jgi:transposase InsO family protein
LVQTLASLGFGGSRSLAQHLARAGWRIGKTTVARYLREPRTPGPEMRPTNSTPPDAPKRAVQARFTHHVWHLDLTEIQGFFRSVSFAVVLDSASRMPLSWRLFEQRHTADDMTAFAAATLTRYAMPRHLVVDRDGAFTAHSFRERFTAWRVSLRLCSADNRRANARLERFWRTLKHSPLRLRAPAAPLCVDDLERDIARALHYYAYHRPHQGLGGATPAEIYFGHEPAHLKAVQPPRGRRGEPPVPCPVSVEYLDGDPRFPFLRQAA